MIHPANPIRIGFMPLLDAAIPVVAVRGGFAARHGLEIELVRETSWANVRDRLAIGHFVATHLLAPLPIASALGLMPFEVPLVVPMTLGHGGNAITVSKSLWHAMRQAMPEVETNDPGLTGEALHRVVAQRKAEGRAPLAFAVVHAISSHNYELRYWLAASGIVPDEDVRIAIVPPPYMPDALAAGRIDGFCVGEPWNTVAVDGGFGAIVLTKAAIWPESPDKVLAMRADWAGENPDQVARLMLALVEAAQWCAAPANRDALIAIMGQADILGVRADMIRPALMGRMTFADGPRRVPGMLEFAAGSANLPRSGDAAWYLAQMKRWGQAMPEATIDPAQLLRPDLYRRAAKELGVVIPDDADEAQPCLFDGNGQAGACETLNR